MRSVCANDTSHLTSCCCFVYRRKRPLSSTAMAAPARRKVLHGLLLVCSLPPAERLCALAVSSGTRSPPTPRQATKNPCGGCKSRAAARLIMSLTCFISPAEMSPRALSRASRCNFWACGGLATAARNDHARHPHDTARLSCSRQKLTQSPHAMCMSKLYGTLESCWGCLVQQRFSHCCVHCHTWHQLQ